MEEAREARVGQKGGISTRGLVPVKRRTGRPGCCRFGVDATFSVGDVDMLHGDGRRTVDAHDAAPTQTHRARTEYGEGRTRTIGNWGCCELGIGEWDWDWAERMGRLGGGGGGGGGEERERVLRDLCVCVCVGG